MIITVGGLVGSGKSTLAKKLAEEIGHAYISAGSVMRKMAKEHSMTLLEFSAYAEDHPEVDKEIDERQKTEATDECVADGRLSAYFLDPDLKIWLTAPLSIRAQRILGRGDYSDFEEAAKAITSREASERTRYKEIYGVDLGDLTCYDLVINTEKWGVEQMVQLAKTAVESIRT